MDRTIAYIGNGIDLIRKDKNFLGTLMVVVTSEGLVRVDDREGRSASGDCEGDSNKYEDFSHDRILSKKLPRTIPHARQGL